MRPFIILVLTLSGCATFGPPVKEAEVCQAPPTGALLCFYRNQPAARWDDVDVAIDGKSIGLLENNQWVEVPVAAGNHQVQVSSYGHDGPEAPTVVAVPEGRVVMFHVGMVVMGLFGSVAKLTLDAVPPPGAREEIVSDCQKVVLVSPR